MDLKYANNGHIQEVIFGTNLVFYNSKEEKIFNMLSKTTWETPNFLVLTGGNGIGKSTIFECISRKSKCGYFKPSTVIVPGTRITGNLIEPNYDHIVREISAFKCCDIIQILCFLNMLKSVTFKNIKNTTTSDFEFFYKIAQKKGLDMENFIKITHNEKDFGKIYSEYFKDYENYISEMFNEQKILHKIIIENSLLKFKTSCNNIIDFDDLSSGEKYMTELLLRISIMKYIWEVSPQTIKNFKHKIILLDEYFDRFDSVFAKKILDLLKFYFIDRFDYQVMIISHNSNIIKYSSSIGAKIFLVNKKDSGLEIEEDWDRKHLLSLGDFLNYKNSLVFTESKDDCIFYNKIKQAAVTQNNFKITEFEILTCSDDNGSKGGNFSAISDTKFYRSPKTRENCANEENCSNHEKFVNKVEKQRTLKNPYLFCYAIIDYDISGQEINKAPSIVKKSNCEEFVFYSEERNELENYIYDPIFLSSCSQGMSGDMCLNANIFECINNIKNILCDEFVDINRLNKYIDEFFKLFYQSDEIMDCVDVKYKNKNKEINVKIPQNFLKEKLKNIKIFNNNLTLKKRNSKILKINNVNLWIPCSLLSVFEKINEINEKDKIKCESIYIVKPNV